MRWWQYALLGGAGGALLELLALYQELVDWQSARKTSLGVILPTPPSLTRRVDLLAHAVVMPVRGLLGMCAALALFASGHAANPYVVLGVGAAAPAVLAALGTIHEVNKRLGQRSDVTASVEASRGLSNGSVTTVSDAGGDAARAQSASGGQL